MDHVERWRRAHEPSAAPRTPEPAASPKPPIAQTPEPPTQRAQGIEALRMPTPIYLIGALTILSAIFIWMMDNVLLSALAWGAILELTILMTAFHFMAEHGNRQMLTQMQTTKEVVRALRDVQAELRVLRRP